ncbi:MAG TPA: hypothetical protein VGO94_04055 [Mycobacteriales bacterium]|nr:hypothetical protein [Mycobacteriales bacterium]
MLGDDLERWLGEVPTLHEVLPVQTERPARGGGRLVVTSLELWGDRAKWNVAQFPPPAPPAAGEPLPKFALTDDAGTEYHVAGGGAGGDGRWWTEYVTFSPVPPAHATVLRLTGGALAAGAVVTVALAVENAA